MKRNSDADARELRDRLLAQEERLSLALRAANLGTWEHVPKSGEVYWDQRSKEILGLSPEQSLSMAEYGAMLHPAAARCVRRHLEGDGAERSR